MLPALGINIKHKKTKLLIFLALALLTMLMFRNVEAEPPMGDERPIMVEVKLPTPEELVYFYFNDDAVRMLSIFKCESGLRQFKADGTVVMSPTRDFGYTQINEKTWDKKARELNLDYKGSVYDNIRMAKYVYDNQGHDAWVCNSKV